MFLFFVLSLCTGNAQDTLSSEKFLLLAQKFKDADAVRAIEYARQAFKVSQNENAPRISVNSCLLIGKILHDENQLPEAYEMYRKALNISISIKDSQLISKSYYNIGDIYKRLSMFNESVHYLEKALKMAEQIKDSTEIAMFSNKLGHVHMDEGERSNKKELYDKALGFYNYSLKINTLKNDPFQTCISYVNLANAHLVFLKHGADTSNAGTSIAYSLEGLAIAQKNLSAGRPDIFYPEKAIHLLNIGEAYLLVKKYDNALTYFQSSFEIYSSLKLKLSEASVLRDMALAYKGKKEIEKAITSAEKANELGWEFNKTEQPENYLLLAELYASKKDFKKAFEASQKYQALEKISLNTKSTLELEKIQMQYDTESKDKEILFLNQQNKLIEEKIKQDKLLEYFLAGVILLAMIVSILLYNRSRLLQRSKDMSDRARIMQEQFLANTSHEIRTPMNGIIGMANQLMSSPLSEEQKEYVQVMKKSSDNLLHIINDLLDLSKIKAGKLEFFPKAFDTKIFFQELHILMHARAKEKEIALVFSIGKELPPVLIADELRLEQILLNLLDNALKFTNAGKIELKANVKETAGEIIWLEFNVSDTGEGIPENKIGTIFESFVQLENPGQRKHGGTGLGLSIVKYMVENMGGEISVKSEEGKGSEFSFFLPVKTDKTISEASTVIAEEMSAGQIEKNLDYASILIVEDNAINQKVIVSTLMKWNCQFTIAESAVECFDELGKEIYDIILMDIELPGISGIGATKYIREKFSGKNKTVPIIAFTAYAYESEKIKCLEAGMDDVVPKPFSEDELYSKIVQQLNKKMIKSPSPIKKENSLKELSLRYKNEPEEFKALLELFKNEIPVYMEELKNILTQNDPAALKKQVHKMKSPLNLAGAVELVEKLEEMCDKNFVFESDEGKNRLKKIEELKNQLMAEIGSFA